MAYCSNCDATIDNFDVRNGQSHGAYLYNGTVNLSNGNISSNGKSGVYGMYSSVGISGSSISGNSSYGVYSEGQQSAPASHSVVNSVLSNNLLSGLYVKYSDGDISGNQLESNSEYGLSCEATNTIVCGTNIFTANLLGEQTGCDASCGEEANPGGGNTDTGGLPVILLRKIWLFRFGSDSGGASVNPVNRIPFSIFGN